MNVVVYARYSSHNQNEQSIEGQLEYCRNYAKQHNYNIIGEYIDRAQSGTNDDRPEFKKMIEDSNKKTFEGVLVYQLDRFARSRYDSAVNKAKLKKNGVRVFSARENISDDASGVLMESVLEGMAEYFSAELGQKVKRGMKINADNCYYNGGTVPLGLKLIEVDSNITDATGKIVKKKKYAIDEDTAPIVQKIFEMYNNGDLMADIIRYMNDRNIKTVTGYDFNRSSIRRILLNKKYIGIYTYNGVETPDAIPRIIDDASFNKVHDIMFKNKKAPARARAKTEYLLTTKLFCGHCKESMTGYSGTSKTGKLHNYYMCNNARKKLCDKKSVQKDYIEDLVVEQAREVLTDDNIKRIAEEVVKIADKERESTALKRLNKMLKENEQEIEIVLKKQDSILDLYDLGTQLEKIENRKIWLKCGGFITIDKTEALTAIDVNSGKYIGTSSLEQTVYTVNKEASIEIAKQLRLRDIGGIIIIDYIDMKEKEHKEKIIQVLQENLKNDRSKTQIVGFTELNLLEMTRKHMCSND